MPAMTPDQNRCSYLSFRCFTGFDRRDNEKQNPIPEGNALEEWKELLEKRFSQNRSGGKAFVLKIVKMVNDKKTEEGLNLADSILEHLAKWCQRMCKEHEIDPGSQAMQALQQQANWHEESMEAHATTHANQEATHSLLTKVATGMEQVATSTERQRKIVETLEEMKTAMSSKRAESQAQKQPVQKEPRTVLPVDLRCEVMVPHWMKGGKSVAAHVCGRRLTTVANVFTCRYHGSNTASAEPGIAPVIETAAEKIDGASGAEQKSQRKKRKTNGKIMAKSMKEKRRIKEDKLASDNETEEEAKAPHFYLSFLLSRSDLLAKYTCLSVL